MSSTEAICIASKCPPTQRRKYLVVGYWPHHPSHSPSPSSPASSSKLAERICLGPSLRCAECSPVYFSIAFQKNPRTTQWPSLPSSQITPFSSTSTFVSPYPSSLSCCISFWTGTRARSSLLLEMYSTIS